MKRFLLTTVALILFFIMIVWALELPSTYTASESINKNAPVQTNQKIAINASQEKIYKITSNVNEWASWQSDIQQPIFHGAFQKGNSFNWKGGGLTIHSTIHTATAYNKKGWSG